MRWRIEPKDEKGYMKFLLLPRYCGKCGTAIWLEWVRVLRINMYCPVCNHDFITRNKKVAREWYAESLLANTDGYLGKKIREDTQEILRGIR